MKTNRLPFQFLLLSLALLVLWGCGTPEKQTVRFAFLTDIHVQPGSESSDQLREMVSEINSLDFDRVIITGDLSNTGTEEELLNVKEILDELVIPYHILPGNHETNWSESAGYRFIELWGDDKFVFRDGSFLFVGINTGPFMRMGDGHVRMEDIRWLERTLEENNTPGTQVLFFSHYPLAEGLDQWYLITEILQEYNTVAAFCGHGHRLEVLNLDGIPGIMGRARVYRGRNVPGYNIVEVSIDTLRVYEKILSQPKDEPVILFATSDLEFLSEREVSPLPDYSFNDVYPDIFPLHHFTDTASIFTGPLVLGDTVVVYGNSAGLLKAIRVASEEVKWKVRAERTWFSTPVITGQGIVIAANAGGEVFGIDVHSGEILWQQQFDAAIVAPPLVDEEQFFLGVGTLGMYSMDIASGEILWQFDQVDGLIQSRPALKGDHLVFTAWDRNVYCLDKRTGALRWSWNNDRPPVLFSPGNVVPVISHNKVFIVAPDRHMTALDLRTGAQIWRTNEYQVRESMGISPDGENIFAKTMENMIIAVSASSDRFRTNWVLNAGFGYDHNPIPFLARGNMAYTATRNGLVIAINTQTQRVAWRHKVGNAAVNFFYHGDSDYVWLTTACGQVIALPAEI